MKRVVAYSLVALTTPLVFGGVGHHGSITDTSIALPSMEEIIRLVTLRDYNTRVVVIGTMVLGLAAGIVGTFMLLRKRSLMGDAISHATLPGIGLAFIAMTATGGNGKSLPILLLGGFLSGLVGMLCILFIRKYTRIKEDAALGVVLGVFFGLGAALLGVIQKMNTGHAAGLESFIYGKTASMLAADAKLIAIVATAVVVICALLYKEFALLCFDQNFSAAQGWPVLALDIVMMIMVVVVTVTGLQAVGLILIIALLIIPPAAARFWSDDLLKILVLSGVIGAASGLIGSALSALTPRLPAGAIIVLVAAGFFAASMVFGTARGLLLRCCRNLALSRTVGRQHLLRALYEWHETNTPTEAPTHDRTITHGMAIDELLGHRSWSAFRLRRVLARAFADEVITLTGADHFRLTERGMAEARRIVRNHRLWELYLITHADVAPGKVDRDADQIEHILGTVMVEKLERVLQSRTPHLAMPSSPHAL